MYDMICRADTIGVFQIESRAQMSMLPRLQPREFYDLVIEVAIVRPGPIQGNMVHPVSAAARGRGGGRRIRTTRFARCCEKTLGVPMFQEQAMRLAVVAAGFTPGEADQLRRAMAAWRRPGIIEQFRQKLIDGMRQRTYRQNSPSACSSRSTASANTAFPNRTPPASRCLVYVSAWLKCYYPAAFCRGADQQPADGLLCAGAARARCARAWRRSAAGGCELQRLGLHAGSRRPGMRVGG